MEKTIVVEGMTCQNCVKHLRRAMEGLGIEAEIDLATGATTLRSASELNAERIKEAIEEAGYTLANEA